MIDKCGAYLRGRSALVIISSAMVFACLAFGASSSKSPTHDEPLHLYAGYSYLRWGDFRVNPEHPPLAKIIAAIPLLVLDISDAGIQKAHRDVVQVNRDYGWLLAIQWLFSSNDAERLFNFAKLPMVAVGVILGISIFVCAKELYGFSAGLAAVFIFSFDPNFLAHAALIHNDVSFTLAFFTGTYFFWRVLQQRTWLNLFITCLIFGIASLTKFSFVAILPIWALLGLVALFSGPQPLRLTSTEFKNQNWRQASVMMIGLFTLAVIVAYSVIWAGYGFRFEASPNQLGEMSLTQLVQKNPAIATLAAYNNRYHIFPEAWLHGMMCAVTSLGRPSYFYGDISQSGFWWYFPAAVALKTPLPTLLILIMAVGEKICNRRFEKSDVFILIPVIGFLLMAVCSKTNIGLRHIFPIYPFLFVLAGGFCAKLFKCGQGYRRSLPIALGVWLIYSTIVSYPHYLAFFNQLAGGPKGGLRYFVDSNLDWGQDLKGLKKWMDSRGLNTIALAYFGTVPAAYYGIRAVQAPEVLSLAGRTQKSYPAPKYIGISATHLAGLYLRPQDIFWRYKSRKPISTIGHSIFIYRID